MPDIESIRVVDFGVTIALLLVIYKALTLITQLFVAKKYPVSQVSLACQTDPRHFERIREMHEATMDTEKRKQHGDFACQFKDRDEVRDLIEMMRMSVQATKELTAELRLTRNGRGKT